MTDLLFPGTVTPITTTWTASDGTSVTGTPATVSPPTTTTYTVTTTMGSCVLGTTTVTVTVFPLPVVTAVNSCAGGGSVTFAQAGGAAGGTWSVSGGGTINASTGVFTPTTAGCFTATYKTPGPGCTDTRSFVVFPAAPVLTAPANTCNASYNCRLLPQLVDLVYNIVLMVVHGLPLRLFLRHRDVIQSRRDMFWLRPVVLMQLEQ